MIDDVFLGLILSALFSLAALTAIYALVKSDSRYQIVNNCLHLVMSLAMLAMIWPWGLNLLIQPQLLVFSLAVLWFAFTSIQAFRNKITIAQLGKHPKWYQLFHLVMMLAMIWMLLAMLPSDFSQLATGFQETESISTTVTDNSGSNSHHDHSSLALPFIITGLPLTITLTAGTAVLILDCVDCFADPGKLGINHSIEMAGHSLMSIGMVIMLAIMLL